jgi:hypothetical protein
MPALGTSSARKQPYKVTGTLQTVNVALPYGNFVRHRVWKGSEAPAVGLVPAAEAGPGPEWTSLVRSGDVEPKHR